MAARCGRGILSTVEATRIVGEDGLREALRRHREWMLHAGTTTFEAKSGYGLDRETELASLRAIETEGGIPTWLGAHAVPPEFDDADAYLDFALTEVLPEAAQIAEAADVFLERGAFDRDQARRYLEACRAAGLALRLHGDQFSEQGAIPLAIELGARSVDHLEATGDEGVRTLAGSEVVGVMLPVAALVLGRPMPPGRALVDAGAAVALATDFNPGSAFCESLPLVTSLACTQIGLSPGEALGAVTVNAAHVVGRADRKGLRPATTRTHARRAGLAAPRVLRRRRGVSAVVRLVASCGGARLTVVPIRAVRRRGLKSAGTSTNTSTSTRKGESRSRSRRRPHRRARTARGRSDAERTQDRSTLMAARRQAGAHLAPLMLVVIRFPGSASPGLRASSDGIPPARVPPVQLRDGLIPLPSNQRRTQARARARIAAVVALAGPR